MAAPGEKSATALERERLLALIDRLEQELDAIDADAKAREERLAEIADDSGASEGDRVKASAAILSSQHKRADRAAAERTAARRALRALPTEGDAEEVRKLAAAGKIPTITDSQRIYGTGRYVQPADDEPIDLRPFGATWGDE